MNWMYPQIMQLCLVYFTVKTAIYLLYLVIIQELQYKFVSLIDLFNLKLATYNYSCIRILFLECELLEIKRFLISR